MPTITPTPTLTPTPTPPYDIEERAELIDLCRSLQDYFDEEDNYLVSSEDFNNDPLWDEDTWFDSDWEYMADAAFSLSDQSYELMVIASELPRPRPARDFHDLFTRSATTYYRADSMYYDFLASYGEEHYDEFLVLDQQAFEEYNQALDQWEDLAELYEFDPYMCH
jgi:hypothetical protein